jgi:hypothetical protein
MRKTIIAAAAALLLLIVAGVGWYVFSPGWTIRSMVAAAKARDEARFSAYVDYPALRQDMKTELTARIQQESRKDRSPQAKVTAAIGLALIGPVVDRMVSPGAINQAFTNLTVAAPKGNAKPATPQIRREGFNRFVVAGKDMPEAGLVFERRGLSWKLTGIDLPPMKAPGA